MTSTTRQQVLDRLLIASCTSFDIVLATKVLSQGANPNLQQKGRSILSLAIAVNNIDLVKELLTRGVSPSGNGNRETIPLAIACSQNNLQMVELLLSFNARTDFRDFLGNTVLHVATIADNLAIFRQLISSILPNSPIYSTRNNEGQTVLHLAASSGNGAPMVAMLLEKIEGLETKDKNGNTALDLAINEGSDESCRLLLNKGAFLAAKNIQANGKKENTLLIACIRGDIPTVLQAALSRWPEQLLTSGSLLHFVCRKRNHQSLRLLLQAGANPHQLENADSFPAIGIAVVFNDLTAVQILLDFGASLDCRDREDTTLLHLAIRGNLVEMVQFLLKKNLDKNIVKTCREQIKNLTENPRIIAEVGNYV